MQSLLAKCPISRILLVVAGHYRIYINKFDDTLPGAHRIFDAFYVRLQRTRNKSSAKRLMGESALAIYVANQCMTLDHGLHLYMWEFTAIVNTFPVPLLTEESNIPIIPDAGFLLNMFYFADLAQV